MSRCARPRWRRSPEAGGGSSADDKPSRRARLRFLRWFGPSCSPSCWSQRWPYSCLSLFASGVTNHNQPRQALARHSNSCVCDAGRATSYYLLTRRSDFRFRGRSGHHSAIVYQSRFMSTRLNQSPKPSRTELSHSGIGRASRSFQKRRWQVVAQFDCNKPFARAWALSARRT